MSSDTIGCSGYVVKITPEIRNKLNLIEALIELLKDHDEDVSSQMEWDELLSESALMDNNTIHIDLNGKSIPAEVFQYNADNGSQYDDLEEGESYLIFYEENLYTKKETKEHKALKSLGIVPELQQWSTYG